LSLIDEANIFNQLKVISLIPDEELRGRIEAEMPGCNNSVDRWNIMSTKIAQFRNEKKTAKTGQHILNEIMLQYTYPRYGIV
jgi:hypothetical protein